MPRNKKWRASVNYQQQGKIGDHGSGGRKEGPAFLCQNWLLKFLFFEGSKFTCLKMFCRPSWSKESKKILERWNWMDCRWGKFRRVTHHRLRRLSQEPKHPGGFTFGIHEAPYQRLIVGGKNLMLMTPYQISAKSTQLAPVSASHRYRTW